MGVAGELSKDAAVQQVKLVPTQGEGLSISKVGTGPGRSVDLPPAGAGGARRCLRHDGTGAGK